MTFKQKMGARNAAFKCLQMAALSEQSGNRKKADRWRKKTSECLRISAGHTPQNQLYINGTKTGRFRVIAGGK